MAIDDRAGLSAQKRAQIEGLVSGQRTLEDVVRWGRAHRPPLLVCDVIAQDEFTHDVVVPLPPPDALFLVYDTT